MMKAIWAKNTPYSKFLITVGIILLCATFFTIVSSVIVTAAFGLSMDDLQNMMNNLDSPQTIKALKVIQTISAIGTFIVPPFILAYLFSERPSAYLSLKNKPGGVPVLIVILVMLFATPLINFLGELNSFMHLPGALRGVEDWMKNAEEQAAKLTEVFLNMDSFGDFIINIIMIGLIPAIGEELVFRGVVQKLFGQLTKNIHAGVWISAILFSAIHMQFYGFLPRMILGVFLGYMLVWSGNLWLPIIGHFVNNAGAVLFMYLFQHGYSTFDPDKVGTGSDFASVLVSIIVTIVLLGILYKKRIVTPLSPFERTESI
jgi:membrane protease YdiL (CAAX protease family)